MAAERAKKMGARIRERRQELALTMPELASRMGIVSVTKDYIWRWESGRVEPSADYLEKLAEVLDISVADIMAGPMSDRPAKPTATPDIFGSMNGDRDKVQDQLDRMEAQLAAILEGISHLLPQTVPGPEDVATEEPARDSRKSAQRPASPRSPRAARRRVS